ncbi:hypothetical protein IQ07DRAFT_301336 [Pyrenochaeta sp. DS3sAY3a]|nr:hypothetical protein IQ07DRAFT_301336 [Pyrenochaeta sp. DS3sAY3a]
MSTSQADEELNISAPVEALPAASEQQKDTASSPVSPSGKGPESPARPVFEPSAGASSSTAQHLNPIVQAQRQHG